MKAGPAVYSSIHPSKEILQGLNWVKVNSGGASPLEGFLSASMETGRASSLEHVLVLSSGLLSIQVVSVPVNL